MPSVYWRWYVIVCKSRCFLWTRALYQAPSTQNVFKISPEALKSASPKERLQADANVVEQAQNDSKRADILKSGRANRKATVRRQLLPIDRVYMAPFKGKALSGGRSGRSARRQKNTPGGALRPGSTPKELRDSSSELGPVVVSPSDTLPSFENTCSRRTCCLLLLRRSAISLFGHAWQCSQSSPCMQPAGLKNQAQGLHKPVPCKIDPWLGKPCGGGKPGGARTPAAYGAAVCSAAAIEEACSCCGRRGARAARRNVSPSGKTPKLAPGLADDVVATSTFAGCIAAPNFTAKTVFA